MMAYFNYHATAKRLIAQGKLKYYYFTENHRGISPALVLVFDDPTHPLLPVREARFEEYLKILPQDAYKSTASIEKSDRI